MAAGSMADHDNSVVPGIIAGDACAALGFVVARDAAQPRAQAPRPRGRERAPALRRGRAACVAAGVSVLFPPLAVLVIGGLLALLLGGRRRAGEKYAGLRILR